MVMLFILKKMKFSVTSHRIRKTVDLIRIRAVQNGQTFRISGTQKRQRINITKFTKNDQAHDKRKFSFVFNNLSCFLRTVTLLDIIFDTTVYEMA